jgi:hypothetical protein
MKTLSDFYRLFPSHPAMIVRKAEATSPNTARAPLPASPPANDDAHHATVEPAPRYRSRDYGTGYGRSSGYAQDRSYTTGFGDRMLRVG